MLSEEWRIWGSTPWESHGWEIGEGFVRKWGFLLDEEILSGTNFWRAQRGEEALVLTGDILSEGSMKLA